MAPAGIKDATFGLCLRCVFGGWALPSTQYSHNAQKQINNVHIQRSRTVYGVIISFGYGVGSSPIIANIATKDNRHYPIQNAMMSIKDKYLNQLNNHHTKQSNSKAARYFIKKCRVHRAQNHHYKSDHASHPNSLHYYVGVILAYYQINNQPKRHHHKVIPNKAHHRAGRFFKKINAQKTGAQITNKKDDRVNAAYRGHGYIHHHKPIYGKAPHKG